MFSKLTTQLIDALRCLPGVGPKTAQRLAFYLLDNKRDQGKKLARAIEEAMQNIGYCQECRTFTEKQYCDICDNPSRDRSLLCIVETPADLFAIEQTHSFRGIYFVLMGHLSPIDGIGPQELGLNQLNQRLKNDQKVKEIILATNHTVEGEATAHYLTELIQPLKLKITRIAHGIPLGGELEFVDAHTLANALTRRTQYHDGAVANVSAL